MIWISSMNNWLRINKPALFLLGWTDRYMQGIPFSTANTLNISHRSYAVTFEDIISTANDICDDVVIIVFILDALHEHTAASTLHQSITMKTQHLIYIRTSTAHLRSAMTHYRQILNENTWNIIVREALIDLPQMSLRSCHTPPCSRCMTWTCRTRRINSLASDWTNSQTSLIFNDTLCHCNKHALAWFDDTRNILGG